MPEAELPSHLSIKAATAYSGLTRSRIFTFLSENRLRAVKAGRQSLIVRRSLDDLMNSLPAWKGRA